MDRKRRFYEEHYERIYLVVPKGMKDIVKNLASDRGLSINAYLQDLIRKDQEGMFDTMQIAEKNRKHVAGIHGNTHDGYVVIFTNGRKVHCGTKKDIRAAIISCLAQDKQNLAQDD